MNKYLQRIKKSSVIVTSCMSLSIISACNSELKPTHNLAEQNLACDLKPIYNVQYIGHAFGRGSIGFSENVEKPNSVNYNVSVFTSQNSTPDISIKGIAQCLDGVVTGQFGGGTASKSSISILGGNFEGIFQHRNIDQPFGRWEIKLFDSEKKKNYDLKGYWQESYNVTHTSEDIASK